MGRRRRTLAPSSRWKLGAWRMTAGVERMRSGQGCISREMELAGWRSFAFDVFLSFPGMRGFKGVGARAHNEIRRMRSLCEWTGLVGIIRCVVLFFLLPLTIFFLIMCELL